MKVGDEIGLMWCDVIGCVMGGVWWGCWVVLDV